MDLTSKLAKLAAGRCWDGYEPVPGKGAYTDDSCRKTGKKKKKREKSAKSPAWQRKSGKNSKGGLNEKGRKSYESENPGSDLKAPVTGKVKPGGKAAKRRKSFCARMSGNKGPMKKPNGEPTRKALSLRKWKCGSDNQPTNKDSVIMEDQLLRLLQEKLASNCGGSHAVPKKKKKKLKVKVAHCGCKKSNCPAPECVAERKEKKSADLRLKLASHLIRHTLADEKTATVDTRILALLNSIKSFGKKTALPAAGTGVAGYGLGHYKGFGAGQDSLNDLSLQELVEQAMASKQASLKGDQHKLDVNKNGKLEGSDLKKLRGRGKNEKVALDRIRLKLASNVIKQAEEEGAGIGSILARLGLILGGSLIGGSTGARGAGALVRKFGKRAPIKVNMPGNPKLKKTLERQLGGIMGGPAMAGGGLGGMVGGGILGNMGANALNKESALKGVTKKAVAAQLILEKVANDPYMSDMEKAAMLSAALKGLRLGGRALQGAGSVGRYMGKGLQGAGNMSRYMGKGLQQGVTSGGNLSRAAGQPGLGQHLGRGMQGAGGLAQSVGRGMQGAGGLAQRVGRGMQANDAGLSMARQSVGRGMEGAVGLAQRGYQAASPVVSQAGRALGRQARVRSKAYARGVSRSPFGQAVGNAKNTTRDFVRQNPLLVAGGAYAAGNYGGQGNAMPNPGEYVMDMLAPGQGQ